MTATRIALGAGLLAANALTLALAGCASVADGPPYTPQPVIGVQQPPISYGPPTVAYGAQPAVPYGDTCYAGFYTCTLPASATIGSQCSCPGLGAPSYGMVR